MQRSTWSEACSAREPMASGKICNTGFLMITSAFITRARHWISPRVLKVVRTAWGRTIALLSSVPTSPGSRSISVDLVRRTHTKGSVSSETAGLSCGPTGAKYTTHRHARGAFMLEHAYKHCAHSVLRQLIDPVISLAL